MGGVQTPPPPPRYFTVLHASVVKFEKEKGFIADDISNLNIWFSNLNMITFFATKTWQLRASKFTFLLPWINVVVMLTDFAVFQNTDSCMPIARRLVLTLKLNLILKL